MTASDFELVTKGSKDTPKTAFLERMLGRMFAGDPAVFEDCCTEDFKMTNPEFHLISPDGSLRGAFAIETMSRYFRNDGTGYKKVGMETVWTEETETRLYREVRWTASEPFGSYGGFEEGERADDLKVVLRVIEIVTFRDGRICEIHGVYDHLGYYHDMAGGDFDLMAKAIRNSQSWWGPQLEKVKQGIIPIPDPGNVFDKSRANEG